MSTPPTNPDLMQYEAMAQDALRGVVKMALKRAASPPGLPGDHHFYITFKTRAPGVSGPPELLGQYPDEMKIVLQHQYWDLAPGETFFAVTLKFGGHQGDDGTDHGRGSAGSQNLNYDRALAKAQSP